MGDRDCKKDVEKDRAELIAAAQRWQMLAEMARPTRTIKTVDHYEEFIIEGTAEEIKEIEVTNKKKFRIEKLQIFEYVAPDEKPRAGCGEISEFVIAGKNQFPPTPINFAAFWPNSLSCGVSFDTAYPEDVTKIKMKFREAGTIKLYLYGQQAP